jgi:hypothetical protein
MNTRSSLFFVIQPQIVRKVLTALLLVLLCDSAEIARKVLTDLDDWYKQLAEVEKTVATVCKVCSSNLAYV